MKNKFLHATVALRLIMDDFDVVIIGAGPAGVASAITIARTGASVAVVEKNHAPHGKVCGEGILPPGLARLKSLGILRHLSPDQSYSIKGLGYMNEGHRSETSFREGPGLGINRQVLSCALWATLKEYPNISLIHGTEFVSFNRDNNGVNLSNNLSITTKFLIGADGLRSKVRKSLDLEASKSSVKRWAINAHFSKKPWSNMVEIYLSNKIEAYVTPINPYQINLVFLWSPDNKLTVRGPHELFNHFLMLFPELAARLKSSHVCEQPRAIGPFFNTPKTIFSGTKAALVGDAAGYIDPLTGEGISLGLFSGMVLGQILGHRLKNKQAIKLKDLANYQNILRNHSRAHVFLTKNLLHLIKYPRLTTQAVKILERWPSLLGMLASFNMGSYQKSCPYS